MLPLRYDNAICITWTLGTGVLRRIALHRYLCRSYVILSTVQCFYARYRKNDTGAIVAKGGIIQKKKKKKKKVKCIKIKIHR